MKQNLIAKCLKICTVKCSTTRSGQWAFCWMALSWLVSWCGRIWPPPVPLYPAGTSCFKRLTFFKNCILKVNWLELNKKSKNMYKKYIFELAFTWKKLLQKDKYVWLLHLIEIQFRLYGEFVLQMKRIFFAKYDISRNSQLNFTRTKFRFRLEFSLNIWLKIISGKTLIFLSS